MNSCSSAAQVKKTLTLLFQEYEYSIFCLWWHFWVNYITATVVPWRQKAMLSSGRWILYCQLLVFCERYLSNHRRCYSDHRRCRSLLGAVDLRQRQASIVARAVHQQWQRGTTIDSPAVLQFIKPNCSAIFLGGELNWSRPEDVQV